MLSKLFKRMWKGEKGITGLETAIILIAFVVVAAVFAYTVLSAGLFSTQKAQEAVYSGLKEARSTLELRGATIATANSTGASGEVKQISFIVSNVLDGEPIDFTEPTADSATGLAAAASNNVVVINYRDADQVKSGLDWSATWLGTTDGDFILEQGELAEIAVSGLEVVLDPDLGVNTSFVIEVSPPKGAVLVLERTTPVYIDKVMDLR